jgi:hypothetical protein
MFKDLFLKPCRLWDDAEKYGTATQATDDSTIWRMCIACWIAEATETHSEYVILIAFPRQQLRESAFSYMYTYIYWLFKVLFLYFAWVTDENQENQSGLESKPGTPEYESGVLTWVSRFLLVAEFCDILGKEY